MNADDLRAAQAPLKAQYRDAPQTALVTLRARGMLDVDNVACRIETGRGPVTTAGLHEKTGGDGSWACSGDMLLESLVACAGVTLCAVATAMELPLHGGIVTAEGDIDFRGTLGVDRDAPVGLSAIRLHFQLDTDADEPTIGKLLELTERYCVVAQTLIAAPGLEVDWRRDRG